MRAWSRDPKVIQGVVLIENVVQRLIGLLLRLLGRHRPMVIAFLGYGTADRVRIGARVVYGGASAVQRRRPAWDSSLPADSEFEGRRSRRASLRSSLSRFLTIEVPGEPITVTVQGTPTTVPADREGYLNAVIDLPGGLPPGWHTVEFALTGGDVTASRLVVVDPRAEVAVISDVDDTILETGLTRGLAFLQITLMTHVTERAPLPGAAALYRALTTGPDGGTRPVFYLSTSPWNLHGMLLQFLHLRRFPLGPLLLTDWGPGHGSLFRIGAQEHKLSLIRQLLTDYPRLGLVLIGDSGQLDPEIYAAAAAESPDRLRAVYIRRTPHGARERVSQVDELAARVTAAGVPMLAVDDSMQIAMHAVSLGLLDPSALDTIRVEMTRH